MDHKNVEVSVVIIGRSNEANLLVSTHSIETLITDSTKTIQSHLAIFLLDDDRRFAFADQELLELDPEPPGRPPRCLMLSVGEELCSSATSCFIDGSLSYLRFMCLACGRSMNFSTYSTANLGSDLC